VVCGLTTVMVVGVVIGIGDICQSIPYVWVVVVFGMKIIEICSIVYWGVVFVFSLSPSDVGDDGFCQYTSIARKQLVTPPEQVNVTPPGNFNPSFIVSNLEYILLTRSLGKQPKLFTFNSVGIMCDCR